MSFRYALLVPFMVALLPVPSQAADDRNVDSISRTFHCFLYEGPNDLVWVGHPLKSLGMIGVHANPPQYHLSPEVRQQLAPLVSVLKDTPEQPQFWWFGIPDLKDGGRPLVFLNMKTSARPVPSPPGRDKQVQPVGQGQAGSSRRRQKIYEITSAELVYAEFISKRWIDAFQRLETDLAELVSISRTAPGKKKTADLIEVMERCSVDLNKMANSGIDVQHRDVVQKIEPQARAVRKFQRRLEEGSVEWGGQLRQYSKTLQINPTTPFPKISPTFPKIRWLAESESALEFQERVASQHSQSVNLTTLIYSEKMERVVFVWQVADLNESEFSELRKQAQEQLRKEENAAKPSVPVKDKSTTISQWGVVVEPASPQLSSKNKLLRATIVQQVDGQSTIGLRKGDLIVDYERPYDLVMGGYGHFNAQRRLASSAKYDGELLVLRGDELVTVPFKKAAAKTGSE